MWEILLYKVSAAIYHTCLTSVGTHVLLAVNMRRTCMQGHESQHVCIKDASTQHDVEFDNLQNVSLSDLLNIDVTRHSLTIVLKTDMQVTRRDMT